MTDRKILTLTRAGKPILREEMPEIPREEILSNEIQDLIADIRYTNQQKQYGVGLAAPQVGVRKALSVIGIKPTPNRPNLEVFDQVIINPKYEGIGEPVALWEGCQSVGSGDDILYAQAQRYEKIDAEWFDEKGEHRQKMLDGFVAHVFQHETDHLSGILFVDRVRDTKTYMMADEYRERVAKKRKG